MIATGWTCNSTSCDAIQRIELVNTKSMKSTNTSYFPIQINAAVSFKEGDKVVICGGVPTNPKCYGYEDMKWSAEDYKLEPARYGAASVEIRPNEWLVIGGASEALGFLTDTKLFRNGKFYKGPELPVATFGASVVMLNETHLFIALGVNWQSDRSRNFLFNIETFEWTQIANRNFPASSHHSSGLFFNSTANEIQIANIGCYGIEIYSPTSNSWHSIKSEISSLSESVAVQQENSFILIGGNTKYGPSKSVFVFNENGLNVLKENVLASLRYLHVAIPTINVSL